MSRPTLIFDFDGTVALGHGPVLAYAAAVAQAAGLGNEFARKAEQMITEGVHRDAIDAYDLVRMLAVEAGADQEALDAGYRVSRALLATKDAEILAPAGLAAFLKDADAQRILITNAPEDRLHEALEALGLSDVFDRVISGGNKPTGLARLLDELVAEGQQEILCIGDIWQNDLAPAHERGLETALVGAWGKRDHPATYRAADVAALLPTLREWLN